MMQPHHNQTLSVASRPGGASLQTRQRLVAAAGGNLGLVGTGQSTTSKSMYSPNGASNMLVRSGGLNSNNSNVMQGPSQLRQPTMGSTGNRRADMLAMLNRPGPTQPMPQQQQQQPRYEDIVLAQERVTADSLNTRLAQVGGQQPAASRLATRMVDAGLDPSTALGTAAQAMPVAEPPRRQGGLPRAGVSAGLPAGFPALPAPAVPDGTAKSVALLTEEIRRLQAEVADLKRASGGVSQLRSELAAQRRTANEEMSAELSNACCLTRALTLHNTIEYQLDVAAEPSARGLPQDDDMLAAGLENAPSVSVPANSEVVLVYPMYTRSLEDAGLGDEIYMRRRHIDAMSAEVRHTYIKVMGTYDGETIQYIGNFHM
jgi:hypothetical protein